MLNQWLTINMQRKCTWGHWRLQWERYRPRLIMLISSCYLVHWLATTQYSTGRTGMEVIQVAVTLCEVCQADWRINTMCVSCKIILHFLSFFEGIMQCNFEQQILVRIVKLLADGYFQREEARMMCCNGSSGKILRCNRDIGWSYQWRLGSWRSLLDGTLNLQCHIRLLHDGMVPMATSVFRQNFVNVQDNAMPSTAHSTNAFLGQQDVELWDWSAQGPDMSSTEHVWRRDIDDLDPRHRWSSFHSTRIVACCPPGVGCLPEKCKDPGGENVTSCAFPSRGRRGWHEVLVVWCHEYKHV